MDAISDILVLIGSITVLTVGIELATESVSRRYMPWMKRAFDRSGSGAMRHFLRGALSTAPTGSVRSGVLFLVTASDTSLVPTERTVAVVLGINLGATAVVWAIAVGAFHAPLATVALILLAIALPLRLSAALSERSYDAALIGVGLTLIAIDLLTGSIDLGLASTVIPGAGPARDWLVPLGWLAGVALAAAGRSTVSVVVVAMALGLRGALPADVSFALVIGSVIGIAGVGAVSARRLGTDARRAAMVAVIVALIATATGAAVAWPVGTALLPWLERSGRFAAIALPIAIATLYSAMHGVSALVAAPIGGVIAGVVSRVVQRSDPQEADGTLGLLPANIPDSLEPNLTLLQSRLARMAEIDSQMLMIVMNVSQDRSSADDSRDRIAALRDTVAKLGTQITAALTRSVQQPTTRDQAEWIRHQQRVADELTRISEACTKVVRLLRRSHRKEYRIHDESQDELFAFSAQVLDFLRYNTDYLDGRIDSSSLDLAEQMEETIDKMRDKLNKRARKVLETDQDAHIRGELAFIEIVGHLEHIGDSCLAIAETVPMLKRSK